MNKRRSETRELLGYVAFENDLDPWLTLQQNIEFNARLYSVEKSVFEKRLKKFSDALNLNAHLNKFAYRVSGGIQKKAMLVRALIHDPDILIMDEWLSVGDDKFQQQALSKLTGMPYEQSLKMEMQ